MVKRDDFFRETTLRICGNLQITTAIASVFDYFKLHFPIIAMSLSIRDDDLGAIRRIALATDNQDEYPEEIVPLPKHLWMQVQTMVMDEPQIITSDQNELIGKLAALFKLKDRTDLILPLRIDDKLRGGLALRAAQEGCFTKQHIRLLATITQPFTIALANAIAKRTPRIT